MKIVKQTDTFLKWLKKLKDTQAKVSILRRIERMKKDNFGDYKSIGNNLWELRLTVGAGYRIYYTKHGNEIVILLVGGDKSTQQSDIEKAKKLLEEIEK
jgi:putative addiction module killer protein